LSTSKEEYASISLNDGALPGSSSMEAFENTPTVLSLGGESFASIQILAAPAGASLFQLSDDAKKGGEIVTLPSGVTNKDNRILLIPHDMVCASGSSCESVSQLRYASMDGASREESLTITIHPVSQAPSLMVRQEDVELSGTGSTLIALKSSHPDSAQPVYIITELPEAGYLHAYNMSDHAGLPVTSRGARITAVGQEVSGSAVVFSYDGPDNESLRFSYTVRAGPLPAMNIPETTVALKQKAKQPGYVADVAGDAGYAALFGSESSGLRATMSPATFTEFTFGIWMNSKNAFSSTREVMLAEVGGVFELNVTRVGSLVLKVYDSSGSYSLLKESLEGNPINDKSWHYIAVALEHRVLKEDNIATVKVYVDGKEIASQVVFLNSLKANPTVLSVGSNFAGMVDEVSFWNKFFSSSHSTIGGTYEWSFDGRKPLTGREEGLLLYYRFNDVRGTSDVAISDSTGKSELTAHHITFEPSSAPVGDLIDVEEGAEATYVLQGSANSITITTLPTKGVLYHSSTPVTSGNTVFAAGDFEFTYVPGKGETGSDSLGYVSGASAEALVSINIKPVMIRRESPSPAGI